jgi:hypothetical protein
VISHIELDWEVPSKARFLTRLASICRLLKVNQRGTGMSDRDVGVTTSRPACAGAARERRNQETKPSEVNEPVERLCDLEPHSPEWYATRDRLHREVPRRLPPVARRRVAH